MFQLFSSRIGGQFYVIGDGPTNGFLQKVVVTAQAVQKKPLGPKLVESYFIYVEMLAFAFIRQDGPFGGRVDQNYRISRKVVVVLLEIFGFNALFGQLVHDLLSVKVAADNSDAGNSQTLSAESNGGVGSASAGRKYYFLYFHLRTQRKAKTFPCRKFGQVQRFETVGAYKNIARRRPDCHNIVHITHYCLLILILQSPYPHFLNQAHNFPQQKLLPRWRQDAVPFPD